MYLQVFKTITAGTFTSGNLTVTVSDEGDDTYVSDVILKYGHREYANEGFDDYIKYGSVLELTINGDELDTDYGTAVHFGNQLTQ